MTEQYLAAETPYARFEAWLTATAETLRFSYRIHRTEGFTLAVCDGMRPIPPARGTNLDPEAVQVWVSEEDRLEVYRGVERLDPSVSKESAYVPYSRRVENSVEGHALLRLPYRFAEDRWLTSRVQADAVAHDVFFSVDVRYREGADFRTNPTPVEGYVLVNDLAAKLGRLEVRFDTLEVVFVSVSP